MCRRGLRKSFNHEGAEFTKEFLREPSRPSWLKLFSSPRTTAIRLPRYMYLHPQSARRSYAISASENLLAYRNGTVPKWNHGDLRMLASLHYSSSATRKNIRRAHVTPS